MRSILQLVFKKQGFVDDCQNSVIQQSICLRGNQYPVVIITWVHYYLGGISEGSGDYGDYLVIIVII